MNVDCGHGSVQMKSKRLFNLIFIAASDRAVMSSCGVTCYPEFRVAGRSGW